MVGQGLKKQLNFFVLLSILFLFQFSFKPWVYLRETAGLDGVNLLFPYGKLLQCVKWVAKKKDAQTQRGAEFGRQ